MTSKIDELTTPLVRKLGHVYIEWILRIMYMEHKLRRIHRYFYHHSKNMMYAVIRRSEPKNANYDVYSTIFKVQNTYDVCKRNTNESHRYRVSLLATEFVFNWIVSMELMKLDKLTVLHGVDRNTKIGTARFLRDEISAEVWEAFMEMWVKYYVGFPA